MFRLVRCAYVFDVGKGEVEHSYLDEAREGRGNNLGHEHGPRRDLFLSATCLIDADQISDAPSCSDQISDQIRNRVLVT